MKRDHFTNALLCVGGFCMGTVLMDCVGPAQVDVEQAQYCDMVALHQKDPTLGWPDYKGTFKTHCTPAGQPR